MANDLIGMGNAQTDPILGNAVMSPQLLNEPLQPDTVQTNPDGGYLPKPSLSQLLLATGMGLLSGAQYGGGGWAGGIGQAAINLQNAQQQAQLQAKQQRKDQLTEYELLGRMRDRQFAELAASAKTGAISRLKTAHPELADLIDLDPNKAAEVLAKKGAGPEYKDVGGNLYKFEYGKEPTLVQNPGGGAGSGAANVDPTATGDAALEGLPIGQQTIVKNLSNGQMAFPSGAALKSPYWQNMINLTAQYDPSFDAVNYNARNETRKAFSKGKEAQEIKAAQTAIGHAAELYDHIDALENLSGFPGATYANMAKNAVSNSGGANTAINDFNTIRDNLVDEVTKFYNPTSGTLAERQERKHTMSSDLGPDQLKSSLLEQINLMSSKLDALDDQYQKGMSTTGKKYEFLSPKTRAALVKIGYSGSDEMAPITDDTKEGTAQPALAPALASPAAAPGQVPTDIQPAPETPATAPARGMLDDGTADPMAAPAAAPIQEQTGTQQAPAQPVTKADFDALPSGSYFVNPKDGKVLRKK